MRMPEFLSAFSLALSCQHFLKLMCNESAQSCQNSNNNRKNCPFPPIMPRRALVVLRLEVHGFLGTTIA